MAFTPGTYPHSLLQQGFRFAHRVKDEGDGPTLLDISNTEEVPLSVVLQSVRVLGQVKMVGGLTITRCLSQIATGESRVEEEAALIYGGGLDLQGIISIDFLLA